MALEIERRGPGSERRRGEVERHHASFVDPRTAVPPSTTPEFVQDGPPTLLGSFFDRGSKWNREREGRLRPARREQEHGRYEEQKWIRQQRYERAHERPRREKEIYRQENIRQLKESVERARKNNSEQLRHLENLLVRHEREAQRMQKLDDEHWSKRFRQEKRRREGERKKHFRQARRKVTRDMFDQWRAAQHGPAL